MKFYNREKELEALNKVRELSFNKHSMLTVLTGRRRIGKTLLIKRSCDGTPTVYLFVSRSNEAALCRSYVDEIRSALNVFVPDGISTFADTFQFLMDTGTRMKFNLVIDEFQEFFFINPEVYSKMQNIWDEYRLKSNVNLIVSGSGYTLITKIFKDEKEPLFGRADRILKLMPFTTSVLKEILTDHAGHCSNEELLALYTFTGGVPKYVEMIIDNGDYSVAGMINFMITQDSPFLTEGTNLLIQEFGKQYGNYFSILTFIANGKTTIPEMASMMGNISLTGQVKRLEDDYEIIRKKRPIFAKDTTKNVRYEISDMFLRFWFRYFTKYQKLIELQNYKVLSEIIINDFPTYSGETLEMYFRQKMIESQEFIDIGSWWAGKSNNNQNEIDIIGIYADNKRAFIAEVKRQRKNFKPELLQQKIEFIRTKILSKYEIESKCLTMEDM
ncbi:archaeal ATPase family protein [Bacteroides ovatus str. 3725 D9 iii]|uniref:ATP-binding protein n=1 Tax=Bacteroides ovatus TaxID=28116 RepID=UPI0004DB0E04|nr:ATP-binding protein [Bacteroides ovatus]KDS14133.1 archaeal ATPase family protein [Bacteroides ovatus str. 3725 D9 iii]